MARIGQYLKDTHGELRHVAWPTQIQTIVYTVLVALISIVVAVYLGFFDFLFTSGISQIVGPAPASSAIQVEQVPLTPEETAPQVEFGVGDPQ